MSEDPPRLTHLETRGQQRSGKGEARWRRAQRLNLRVGQRTPRHGPPAHACAAAQLRRERSKRPEGLY